MREFNISGSIEPEEHYYVDISPQFEQLMRLIEKRKYFIINRPRQFGKTTMLNFLATHLRASGTYTPVLLSFQPFVQNVDMSEAEFYADIADLIIEELESNGSELTDTELLAPAIDSRRLFFAWFKKICRFLPKKLVLLIDEIDALPETIVLGFLASLRDMFLRRTQRHWPYAVAPHTVVLVGVHDIRNLKARYRDETKSLGTDSPFNIAVVYELPPFSLENISQYFNQHTQETGQEFDDKVIARVHHVTNGHPWLTSVLAKYMVEEIVPDRAQKILPGHAEAAIQKLVTSRNPNFESQYNNAQKPGIFPIVLDLLEGKWREYNIQSDNVALGVKYGVFAEEDEQLILANRIYAQVLYKRFKEELQSTAIDAPVDRSEYEDSQGRLDMPRVMAKFQQFMKAKGASVVKHKTFREATAQWVFFAFLDPLVNCKGWTFKEVQSGEGKIDVLCCYGQQKEVVELKLWYGTRRYEEGLEQLAGYLESEGLDHGYLVVFDRRGVKPKEYTCKEHVANGKKIQAWVV